MRVLLNSDLPNRRFGAQTPLLALLFWDKINLLVIVISGILHLACRVEIYSSTPSPYGWLIDLFPPLHRMKYHKLLFPIDAI